MEKLFKLSTHLKILLIVATIAGILGGIGNYFILNQEFTKNSFLKSVVMGVIAAGVLPLFLKLISSNILDYNKEKLQYKNYISFVSLCLLASLFADTFLQGIYAKVFYGFSQQVRALKVKADDSNKKADYLLAAMKAQKERTAVSEEFKKRKIRKLKTAHQIDNITAEVLYEIERKIVVTPESLYKISNKSQIEKSIIILMKKKLADIVGGNARKMVIPSTNFKEVN